MAKRLAIPVRSLGSEVDTPSVSDLSEWAKTRAGQGGDLVTYHLMKTVEAQKEVHIPAAGGWFYFDRARAASLPDAPSDDLLDDIEAVNSVRKNCWWSLPSAASLCSDPDEDQILFFRQFLRTMRDAGVFGHVILLKEEPKPLELELVSGRRIFLHQMSPTERGLEKVLEVQRDIAVAPALLPLLGELMGSYTVRKIIVMDGGEADLRAAKELVDLDNIMTGGYAPAKKPSYWDELVEGSFILR
ncbi:type III secretion system chaperone family protein [Methanocalculus sp. MC3]